jgi:hypothetical protein
MIALAVHWVWAALGAVGLFLGARTYVRERFVFAVMAAGLLGVLAGTHSGGTDFRAYRTFFARYHDFQAVQIGGYPEVGFQTALAGGNLMGLSYGVVFSFFGVIALVTIVLAVRRIGHNEALYLFLYIPKYFFQGHINHIRSSLVYPFVLLSISWITKGKSWPIILVALLLSTIHVSAILLCLMPAVRNVRLTAWRLILGFAFAIVLSQVTLPVVIYLWELTGIRQLGHVMRATEPVSLASVEVARRMVLFGMVVTLVRMGKHEDKVVDMTCKVFMLAWLFYVGFIDIRIVSDRVGALFGVVEPLVLLTFTQAFVFRSRLFWILSVVLYGVLEMVLRIVVDVGVPLYVPYWSLHG